jgi:two-component system cell cycle sensor histidine kinase/response regulator CckA
MIRRGPTAAARRELSGSPWASLSDDGTVIVPTMIQVEHKSMRAAFGLVVGAGLIVLVWLAAQSEDTGLRLALGFGLIGMASGVFLSRRALPSETTPPAPARQRPSATASLGVRGPAPAPYGRHEAMSHEQLIHAAQMESLGILAGGIAHDFNNLLTGILGNTNLALAELPAGSARDAVLEADTAARRARELVAQILAYSGRGRLELRAVDLSSLSRETLTLLHHVLSPKANVRIETADDARIEADPAQIRQVVMNLLTNASDALGDAPGEVSLRVCKERMSREQLDRTMLGRELPPGRYVRAEVRDTGCGMDAETRARMFEPYFTTKFTGRGLGLAALLGIVRHHRGTLQVHSAPGEGTTMTVWFPATDTSDSPSEGSELPRPGSRTGTILLAEDEEMVRRVATRMLSKLGYEVVAVADGAQAIQCLQEDLREITLALVDVRMPVVDGREVLRVLRERRPELPVVLMTGYAGPDGTEGVSPDAWLRKPFSLKDLVAVLDQPRATAR